MSGLLCSGLTMKRRLSALRSKSGRDREREKARAGAGLAGRSRRFVEAGYRATAAMPLGRLASAGQGRSLLTDSYSRIAVRRQFIVTVVALSRVGLLRLEGRSATITSAATVSRMLI